MTSIGSDTPWRATRTARYAQLLVGLGLYGLGLALMVRAAVGVAPWDVLSQGVSLVTGLPFGLVTNLIGVVVLLFWIPIRQRPGVGTVLNVLLIGPSAQLGLWLVPELESLWVRIPVFAGGLVLVAIATGLYIGANHGPGPRDGLMTGIHRRTGWPIWVVRTAIEVTVLAIGWVLGGNVGLGTLAFALLIGPMVNVTMPLLAVRVTPRIERDQKETGDARWRGHISRFTRREPTIDPTEREEVKSP